LMAFSSAWKASMSSTKRRVTSGGSSIGFRNAGGLRITKADIRVLARGRSLDVEIAGAVHTHQLLAAQEDHLRFQSAARGDPALY